jgi:hypothetical protein
VEVAMAYFKACLSEGAKENCKNHMSVQLLGQSLELECPVYETGVLPIELQLVALHAFI